MEKGKILANEIEIRPLITKAIGPHKKKVEKRKRMFRDAFFGAIEDENFFFFLVKEKKIVHRNPICMVSKK